MTVDVLAHLDNTAFFADLAYEIDGLPYHLSTQIRQTYLKPEANAKDPRRAAVRAVTAD